MNEKIDISNPQALIPGIQLRQHKEREDFALTPYDPSSFSVGGALPVIKDKADIGIWSFMSDWAATYQKHKGVKYVISPARKYAVYTDIKAVAEAFGYDGMKALARAYWTLPRWQNADKTLERFSQHAMSIYEDLQRRKANRE